MPFGIRPFRDVPETHYNLVAELQVSNAFRHSSVSGPPTGKRQAERQATSPMPFGIRPFRDTPARLPPAWRPPPVSNAFRHSSVSGHAGQAATRVAATASLQCLSAFVRFGTAAGDLKAAAKAAGLQCLSAFVRFGTTEADSASVAELAGLQCLSAFVRFGTEFWIAHEPRLLRVSNAFRHSSVSGRGLGHLGGRRSPGVSNAFRHSSVSGPRSLNALRSLYHVSNAFRHSSVSGL